MPKPTKFDLMRAGRERLSAIQREPSIFDGLLPVPTMEIDGVPYREAPETDTCHGCAFFDSGNCRSRSSAAVPVFGGDCVDRNVIYIRAE